MKADKMLAAAMALLLLAGCSEHSSDPADVATDKAAPHAQASADTVDEGRSGTKATREPVERSRPQPSSEGSREELTPLYAGNGFSADLTAPAIVDLPPVEGLAAIAPFPEEVTRYMVARDSCDHFRGEEAYDAERRAFLRENVEALCTGTDARLELLRQRYAHDPAVLSALSGYDDRIEGNASE